VLILSPVYQDKYSGCCTVAAQTLKIAPSS
jgi:hypothetical protein